MRRLSLLPVLAALLGACAPAAMDAGDEPPAGDPSDLPADTPAPEAAPLVLAEDPPFAVEVPADQPERARAEVFADPAFAPLVDALREAGLDDEAIGDLVADASVDRTGHPADPALARWRAERAETVRAARDFLDALEQREEQLGERVDRAALDEATGLVTVAGLPIGAERGAP